MTILFPSGLQISSSVSGVDVPCFALESCCRRLFSRARCSRSGRCDPLLPAGRRAPSTRPRVLPLWVRRSTAATSSHITARGRHHRTPDAPRRAASRSSRLPRHSVNLHVRGVRWPFFCDKLTSSRAGRLSVDTPALSRLHAFPVQRSLGPGRGFHTAALSQNTQIVKLNPRALRLMCRISNLFFFFSNFTGEGPNGGPKDGRHCHLHPLTKRVTKHRDGAPKRTQRGLFLHFSLFCFPGVSLRQELSFRCR